MPAERRLLLLLLVAVKDRTTAMARKQAMVPKRRTLRHRTMTWRPVIARACALRSTLALDTSSPSAHRPGSYAVYR